MGSRPSIPHARMERPAIPHARMERSAIPHACMGFTWEMLAVLVLTVMALSGVAEFPKSL